MTEEVVKTCVSCKHFQGPQDVYTAQMTMQKEPPLCTHPSAASRDMIYGKAFCHTERADKKGCGKQGKLWASKENEKKN